MKNMSTNKQSGAVSLFVVIFAMLLITIVTVSFLRLMIGDLRQATNNDLSQSALDSARAGTEDAKRALLYYQRVCAQGLPQCAQFENASSECNTALRIGDVVKSGDEGASAGGATGEIKVQQSSSGDAIFDQAYTCVTIQLNTDNVEGELANGTSKLVPLKGVAAFDRVRVSWYSQDDISTPSTPINLPAQSASAPLPLNVQTGSGSWPVTRPPILRAQLMQYGPAITLSDFDIVTASSQSNANTLFLYPTNNASTADTTFTGNDIRANSATDTPDPDDKSSSPLATRCESSVAGGGYSCTKTLILPDPIGGNKNNRTAFLHLLPFYKGTHFEVRLFDGTNAVSFKGVQPLIDSTGRANDLFRRVQSRVEMTDAAFPYPQAAVDVTTEFCKDFTVIDTPPLLPASCSY
jgi:Tfp pilus assembly protein PilX